MEIYNSLKSRVEEIFFKAGELILEQSYEYEKTLMNLKIVQAVVMRYIRINLLGKNNAILCTSSQEIIEYVKTGFIRYFSQEEEEKRALLLKYVEEIAGILKTVESSIE